VRGRCGQVKGQAEGKHTLVQAAAAAPPVLLTEMSAQGQRKRAVTGHLAVATVLSNCAYNLNFVVDAIFIGRDQCSVPTLHLG
jgi:hypothetical protein